MQSNTPGVLLHSPSSIVIGNFSFLPAVVSTSTRMHSDFLPLHFVQAHQETEANFTATEMPSQHNSDKFRFRHRRPGGRGRAEEEEAEEGEEEEAFQ